MLGLRAWPSGWWLLGGWSLRSKIHAVLLVVVMALVVVHHMPLWNWFIEDAAITFSFARNFATGEGLVALPGGERVEGYSNPTWMAFLAGAHVVGLTDLFEVARWSQLFLCVGTVPFVYLAAREGFGKDSDSPLVAAGFLAASSQFALWGGSGLENALLNFLFALALWRMFVEIRTGAWPWSAFVWFLVAITRPEAPLFAAIGGATSGFVHLVQRRNLAYSAKWLGTFLVPFGLYHLIRYQYFAWALPNTYYAKLDHKEPLPWSWTRRPWNWTRSFFADLGQAFFLPIWILGAIGDGKGRTALAVLVFAIVGLTIELSDDQRWLLLVAVGALLGAFWLGLRSADDHPPAWLAGAGLGGAIALVALAEIARIRGHAPHLVPMPAWATDAPPFVLAGAAVAVAIVSVGGRAWPMRLVSWLLCVTVVTFAVWAQGDWMAGYRWYAMAVVPGALLFAAGTESLARFAVSMFDRRQRESEQVGVWARLLTFLLLLAQLPGNVKSTSDFEKKPETAPRQVKVRVEYVKGVRDRLHFDGKWTDLDVDMGAHLWWSDFEMMDIAGLVDVPWGHHKFEYAFVEEYVFHELKPEFAHVHGSWASHSKMATHPEWRRDYIEIPGFPAGKNFHIGNYVRKDLIVQPAWPFGGEPIPMGDGLVVYGVHVDAEPGSGKAVDVQVGLAHTKIRKKKGEDDVRVLLFASNDKRIETWDVAPGYDWYWPWEWRADDVFVGKYTLPITLPPGTYDLGLVMLRSDGTVVVPPPDTLPPGTTVGGVGDVTARFATGEIVYRKALTVLTVEDRAKVAADVRLAAVDAAAKGHCEEAEEKWAKARHHRAGEKDWVEEHIRDISRAFANCWAASSDTATDRDDKVHRLVTAHDWDHWAPAYRSRATPLADELMAEGDKARAAEDWETAYKAYTQTIAVEPTRAWARRYAEEARAFRLGIDKATKDRLALETERKAAEAAERRRAAQEKRDLDKAAAAEAEAPEQGG
jgi:hypothetical protein